MGGGKRGIRGGQPWISHELSELHFGKLTQLAGISPSSIGNTLDVRNLAPVEIYVTKPVEKWDELPTSSGDCQKF